MKTVFLRKMCVLSLFATTLSVVQAQTMHYIGLSGKVGYSAMLDNFNLDQDIYTGKNKVIGGVGAGLGLTYELQVNKFRFNTGLEFDFLNAATRLGDFHVQRNVVAPGYPMYYRYEYTKMRETRNVGYLSIPVMFGAYFDRYYFFVGPKIGLNLFANYNMKSQVGVVANDDEVWGEGGSGDLNNVGHGTGAFEWARETSPLQMGLLNVSVAGEFGVNLDEWLAPKPKRRRRTRGRPQPKTFKESLHYRAGVFAEYGVLNTNDFTKNNIASLDGNLSGNAAPAYTTGAKPGDMGMATQLGTGAAENGALNPLFVGAKFTILYEIPKKYRKPVPRPKPRPKPQPKPKPTPPPPPAPVMCGVLVDAETQQRVGDAQIQFLDKEGNVLYEGVATPGGVFATGLNAGTYDSYVNKQGYLPFTGEVVFQKDSIFITLNPLREKKKVVINNLFFATAKTTILPESELALEDLYYLLEDNPTLRIKIIGHTDSVGSDASNQKLSEGRAKSVRDDIIKRGIDPSRIEYEGMGESEPIDTNETEEGRAKNRRVEFEILSAEGSDIEQVPASIGSEASEAGQAE